MYMILLMTLHCIDLLKNQEFLDYPNISHNFVCLGTSRGVHISQFQVISINIPKDYSTSHYAA